MALEKKQIKDVSTSIRSVYQKGMSVLENGSIDYGIEILKGVVQRDPGFLDARTALRGAERKKSAKISAIAKFFVSLKSGKFLVKSKAATAKKPLEAMATIEEALALYLYQPAALNQLADAAKIAGANFISIEALEILAEAEPDNEENIRKLCEFYRAEKDGNNVLRLCQKLSEMHPESLELQGKVREAAALATISGNGGWKDQSGDYQNKMKKAGEKEQKAGDKIVRAEADIKEEIDNLLAKIQAGGPDAESVDIRRHLADFYMRLNQYEKAIEAYEWIVQKMGTLDPAIDKAIERANVAIGRANVEQLKAANAPESDIQAQIQEIYDYRLERYEERVRLYPNDLLLRFELAELYWEGQRVDDALEQFQLAQRQPQKRLYAIAYMGKCFHAKGQNDMAVEQFTNVLDELKVMDDQKMDTLYNLGLTYDDMGKHDDALNCFKQIYSADITYRDVKDRVTANYKN